MAHEVTNQGFDRAQLANMATKAKEAIGTDELTALADRGYYNGDEVLACTKAGITPLVPKPDTSPAKAKGQYSKDDFAYEADTDSYHCPAGEQLTNRFTSIEDGKALRIYWTTACSGCAVKARCTTGKERRIRRWEHEDVLDAMQQRLDAMPEAMDLRRQTAEHVFGTLKHWMGGGAARLRRGNASLEGAGGATHFKMKGLTKVSAEMSLQVLAYNIKRTIGLVGVQPVIAAIRS